MTEVINLNHLGFATPGDDYVFIGRGSIWGNPYKIGRDGTRDECIAKYRVHIVKKLLIEEGLVDELMKLDGKTLGCYCKPEACHGDVLVEIIEVLKDDT